MPDDSIYDYDITELKITDLYCGITYDYTSAKFFFTAVCPMSLFNKDKTYLEMYFEVIDYEGNTYVKSEKAHKLYLTDAIPNHLQHEEPERGLYTWLDWTVTDNNFMSFLKAHACEDIIMRITYYAATSPLSIVKQTHVYYRDDNVVNNMCTVNLPNEGWQMGEYTFHCVYPETRNYTQCECTEQLAYESWNWATEIECVNCLLDEYGEPTTDIELYPGDDSCIVYKITRVSTGTLVKSGEVTINLTEAAENTIIKSTDLVLNYSDTEGIGEDNTMVYTVTNSKKVNVESGEVTVDQKATRALTKGDTFDVSEWKSSPTVATSDDMYVTPSSTETAVFFGKNCYSYWQKYYLAPNTKITARIVRDTTNDGEYAFGLMDVNTENTACKIHYTSTETTLMIGTKTSDIEIPEELYEAVFLYVDRKIMLYFYDKNENILSEHDLGGFSSNYAVYFQTYEDLDSIGCSQIIGEYGGDL